MDFGTDCEINGGEETIDDFDVDGSGAAEEEEEEEKEALEEEETIFKWVEDGRQFGILWFTDLMALIVTPANVRP